MESVNKSETANSPREVPDISLGESESNHSRKSSSSSSSSSSGVVIGLDPEDVILATPPREEDARLDSDNANDEFRDNSDSSPTQSPPAQVMERPTDSPNTDAYRIPSSVFARNKSTAPMEWSVTSNESLFSIQMGNMSFTRDHMNWLKSGELNYQNDPNFPSPMNGPRVDMSSNQAPTPSRQPPKPKSAELGQKNAGGVNESVGVTETKAEETTKELIKDTEDNNSKEKAYKAPINSPSLNRNSDASGGSTKSFAFPILTEDKSTSKHAKSQPHSQPQTPKVAQSESPNLPAPQSQTAKTENAPNKSQNSICKWFSCFPCCANCS